MGRSAAVLRLDDGDGATLISGLVRHRFGRGWRFVREWFWRSRTGKVLLGRRGLGVSRPTVTMWRDRFLASGLAGLDDEPRPGRPKVVDDAAILAATLEPPPEKLAVTHWSTRLLARDLGIGDATVARAWRRYGVQPWRRETFKFSTDPQLEAKVRDVVGLYLNPPHNAVVLCVDEKSQIRRLTGPRRSCRCERGCRKRPPTTTCETAPPRCSPRWRSPPARSPTPATTGTAKPSSATSSRRLPVPTPAASCTLWSTNHTHKHPEISAWLAKHPRVTLHFTPTSGSWLNLVEVFFGIITRQAIRRGSFSSVKELVAAISRFIDGWNERCHPFTWTKTADEILPHAPRKPTKTRDTRRRPL